MNEPRMYIPAARKCGIGQAKVCGLPVVGAVSVHPISDALDEIPLTPGIVYLCERHFRQPLALAEETRLRMEEARLRMRNSHICDKSCRLDRTAHETVFGPVMINTDCRVPPNAWVVPGTFGGPHTCTEADPCDARQPLACPTCAGTGWYRGRLCPEYCSDGSTG